jgi:hypothetical protein
MRSGVSTSHRTDRGRSSQEDVDVAPEAHEQVPHHPLSEGHDPVRAGGPHHVLEEGQARQALVAEAQPELRAELAADQLQVVIHGVQVDEGGFAARS